MRKDNLFAMIGELTIRFATLEHQLQSLLEILVAEENRLIGPFFIHELNLAVLLKKIKYAARHQLGQDDSLRTELERVIRRIDDVRDLRNLLVHGSWHIEEQCHECPVRVRDFKMKLEDGQWQELTETTFNETKLTDLIGRLEGMSSEVEHMIQKMDGSRAGPQ